MAKKNEEKQKKQRERQEETRLREGRWRMKGMEKWKQCKGLEWRRFRKIKYFWYSSLWIKSEKSS